MEIEEATIRKTFGIAIFTESVMSESCKIYTNRWVFNNILHEMPSMSALFRGNFLTRHSCLI